MNSKVVGKGRWRFGLILIDQKTPSPTFEKDKESKSKIWTETYEEIEFISRTDFDSWKN